LAERGGRVRAGTQKRVPRLGHQRRTVNLQASQGIPAEIPNKGPKLGPRMEHKGVQLGP
jgi:hypothetical protein